MTNETEERRLARAIGVAAVLAILLLTLFPYTCDPDHSGIQGRTARETGELAFQLFANTLLFLPLGFGVAAWRRGSLAARAGGAAAAGLVLSAAIEATQHWLPYRVPSLFDLAANTTGALLGGLLQKWLPGPRTGSAPWAWLLPGRRGSLLGWLALWIAATLATAGLQSRCRIADWDDSYPLLIGNEATGDRPWEGRVQTLWMLDRALSTDEIAALGVRRDDAGSGAGAVVYDPIDRAGATERRGLLPPLRPRRSDSHSWLESDGDVGQWTRAALESGELTVVVRAAAADLGQGGPARIVSISRDTSHRNLTLGQFRDALVVRLRTPTTGANGDEPELVARGVFEDSEPRTLAVTYDGRNLRVFVDGARHPQGLEFGPGAAIARSLGRYEATEFPGFEGVYLMAWSALAGCLWLPPLRSRRPAAKGLRLAAGALLPAAALEAALVLGAGLPPSPGRALRTAGWIGAALLGEFAILVAAATPSAAPVAEEASPGRPGGPP